MKVIYNPNTADVEQAIDLIDRILTLLEQDIVQQDYVDPLTISTKYYVVVHNVILPIIMKSPEHPIPKVYLAPASSIYIHDQKIYALFKTRYGIDYIDPSLDRIRLPILDLTSNEKLLILASVSIAYKILLMPSEQNILRIIPNNIKTYIEVAFNLFGKNDWQKNLKIKLRDSIPKNMVEMVLWVNTINNTDLVEVDYMRGIMTRMFRIMYRDYEIDLKALTMPTQRFLSTVLTLLPSSVWIDIINNVKNTYRILQAYRMIYS